MTSQHWHTDEEHPSNKREIKIVSISGILLFVCGEADVNNQTGDLIIGLLGSVND